MNWKAKWAMQYTMFTELNSDRLFVDLQVNFFEILKISKFPLRLMATWRKINDQKSQT